MSLQDDIQALSESGWQALDDSTKARLKASVDTPALQAISDNGWQGVDDSTKAVLRQKWSGPSAQAPAQPATPKRAPSWNEALFPALSATIARQGQSRPADPVPDGLDAVSGAGYRLGPGVLANKIERQWPAARDLLTMPLRAAAGAGAALGQTIGGADGLGGLLQGIGMRRPDVSEAYRSAMASPSGEAAETYAFAPTLQRYTLNPALQAAGAEDPTTIPAMALGGSSMRPLLQGITQSAMGIGSRALDQGTTSLNPEDIHQVVQASDALPALLGGIGPIGSTLKRGGNAWFRQMVKPASVKGGQELEGFNRALEAGLLPRLAGWRATVGGSGEQFLRRLGEEGAEVQPILAAADATGDRVSTYAAVRRAREAVQNAMADRRLATSVPEAKGAIDWLRDRVQIPATREAMDLAWRGIGSPANDILPSQAHRIKSALYDAAFDVAPAAAHVPKAARVMAAKEAARALRSEIAGISPEYAAQMSYLAPLYGAEDAMTRAATIRGNRNVANLMNLINIPAAAQAVWTTGNLLSRAPQVGQRAATSAGALLDGLISAGLDDSFQPARDTAR